MTSCPVCGKPVDSLRAPAVGVRDGRVVSYCSKDCAALAESGPAKLIPTRTMRMPSNEDTDRLMEGRERVVTPSTGVVAVSSGRARSEPRAASPTPAAAAPPRRYKRADSSVQIADTGSIDDYVTHEPRRRGLWIAVVLLVVAGAASAAYFLGYLDTLLGRSSRPAPVVIRDAAVVAPVVPDAAAPITADEALTRAKEVLRTQLKATPHVQKLAAAGLSRTGDAESIELLANAIAQESGDLAKIELAYALARAGDKRGVDALVAAASPTKRESKHEAGHRFALLGDKRAIKILESSLAFPQFRLGVAEELAYFAEPRALAVLDATLADPKALPDDKARATIALGRAGRANIAPALRELLADDRNNAYAAAALANLHDESARPVLEQQLNITSLRVRAARSLRRLDPNANLSSLLPALVAALSSQKDTEQIEIAETILLLVGPPAWSEHE